MKLLYTEASPYARKARIVVLEKGLEGHVEVKKIDFARDRELLRAVNPLGKVPALMVEEDELIHDSPVIVEYLDSLSSIGPVIPSRGKARWQALSDQALADGLMDAAVAQVMYKRATDHVPHEKMTQLWDDKIHAALNAMDTRASQFGDAFDIGQISILCAVDYLGVRFPDLDWRVGRPDLAMWRKGFTMRPSVQATTPRI